MISTAAALLYDMGEELACRMAAGIAGEGRKPRIAVINGMQQTGLKALAESSGELIVQQNRRDICLDLQRAGHTIRREITGTGFDLVLVLAGRQREQTMGWLAAAARLLAGSSVPLGGTLLFCAANDMGAKGYERRLAELGEISVSSKSKCRISMLHGDGIRNPALLDTWRESASPRQLESGLVSCPGVFSWDRPDAGSRLLLQHLPENIFGRGMDLGCGNGYLSMHVLGTHDAVREWHAVDVDAMAVDCTAQNLAALDLGRRCSVHTHWLDATREKMPGNMDVVLLNPPFHKDKADLVSLGQAMIGAAARSLQQQGSLLLVANRHLPYEFQLYDTFEAVNLLYEGEGYKIIRCDGVCSQKKP